MTRMRTFILQSVLQILLILSLTAVKLQLQYVAVACVLLHDCNMHYTLYHDSTAFITTVSPSFALQLSSILVYTSLFPFTLFSTVRSSFLWFYRKTMGNNFCYEQNYYPITAPTVSTDFANLTLKLGQAVCP